MREYILRRLIMTAPVLVGVSLVVFLMVRLIPGDPALVIAGEQATKEEVELIRKQLKLDRPIYVQYVAFLNDLFSGDLGRSTRTRLPVSAEIMSRFPRTVQLAVASMIISIILGGISGIISATKQYSIFDNLCMLIALIGVSMPVFWLGLMLMLLFSITLQWLPPAGTGGFTNLIMPAVTLGAASTAIVARMTRSSMLEVIRQDYIRTARSKGLNDKDVIFRHALQNALIPIVTIVGVQFGTLLSGAVLTETVFAWPGIGRLMVESIQARDYPVVQGATLLVAITFVLINLLVDILYAYIDPRIRYG